jgi:hypothetical protein
MTIDPQVRPPPAAPPDDFDVDMQQRWLAWTLRGRVERSRTARRARALLALAGGVALAVGAFALAR